MRRLPLFLLLPLALTAGARSAVRSEPLLLFGEDWEAGQGDFPLARAARDAFFGYLDEAAVEDFEGARGRVVDLPMGGYGARITGNAKDSVSTALRLTPGRHATSARRYYEHGSDLVVVELKRPAEAIGFYAVYVGDAGGGLRVTVADGAGWEASFPVPHHVVARGDGHG